MRRYVKVSNELYKRVVAFRSVIEAVMEQEIELEGCFDLILEQGLNAMVVDLLGTQDHHILLNSIQQLGAQYPAQVYGYMAETLRRGAAAQERERVKQEWERKKQVGFRPPEDTGSEVQ